MRHDWEAIAAALELWDAETRTAKARARHDARLACIRREAREIGVARLVLRAFVGLQPIGCEPLHYPDPSPANNRLDNLRWAPRGTSKLGRILGPSAPPVVHGSERPSAVLREDQIPTIRQLYRSGWRYKEIAADLGVSEEAIRQVLIGRAWTAIPDPDGPIVMRHGPDSDACANTKLDWDSVAEIRHQRTEGLSYRAIGEKHGVSKATIRDICKRRTWKGRER